MIGQLERVEKLKASLSYNSDNDFSGRNIIAFTSGKGGTGKTVLAVNTALTISMNGYKVLLIDTDFFFGNVNILLNVAPQCTIEDYLSGKKILKDTIHNYSENLDCIYSSSGSDNITDIEKTDVKKFMSSLIKLSSEYDFIILDSSSGGNELQLQIISSTGINVLVLSPEPTSIMDSYVIMKLLKKHRFEGSCYALINKAKETEDSSAYENLRSASKHFLNTDIELLGIINFSDSISESIKNQIPFVTAAKSTDISRSIKKISQRLPDIIQVANNKHWNSERTSFL